MKTFLPISIVGSGSVSALGSSFEEVAESYQSARSNLSLRRVNDLELPVASLSESGLREIEKIRQEKNVYARLDPSVLIAIYATREAMKAAAWEASEAIGVNLASSRGATSVWEDFHRTFLETTKAPVLSSPLSTLGNISSWAAQDQRLGGLQMSHSMTCSSGALSIINAIAWLQSGLSTKVLAGGAEASLTPFTLAQMLSLRIYSRLPHPLACRPCWLGDGARDSLMLGEGAAVFALTKSSDLPSGASPMANIVGLGYGMETIDSPTGVSADGLVFQEAMKRALKSANLESVDLIIMHSPGTLHGDRAEFNAVKTVFGKVLPALTSNKWLLGHTFGASACLSIEYALHLFNSQRIERPDYENPFAEKLDGLTHVMINSSGFGGSAQSIILRRA